MACNRCRTGFTAVFIHKGQKYSQEENHTIAQSSIVPVPHFSPKLHISNNRISRDNKITVHEYVIIGICIENVYLIIKIAFTDFF